MEKIYVVHQVHFYMCFFFLDFRQVVSYTNTYPSYTATHCMLYSLRFVTFRSVRCWYIFACISAHIIHARLSQLRKHSNELKLMHRYIQCQLYQGNGDISHKSLFRRILPNLSSIIAVLHTYSGNDGQ